MRLTSRLATAGALATLTIATAVGGTATASATSTSVAAVAPGQVTTAGASGTYACLKGLADCRSKRNYYQYLGCRTSPIYGSWDPSFYYFTYWC